MNDIRRVMLEVLSEASASEQVPNILEKVIRNLDIKPREKQKEQAVLTVWHDLMISGYVAYGTDIENVKFPFFHITDKGRAILKQVSRDPTNPDGYYSYLTSRASLNSVALSYIEEAVNSFNNGCIKAAAVMVGVAVESIILEIRDNLVSKMKAAGRSPSSKIKDWKIKTVIDGLKKEFEMKQKEMPDKLNEACQAYFPAFTHQVMTTRNDAGHPASLGNVTFETVHASLLIFPELANLSIQLNEWISTNYN